MLIKLAVKNVGKSIRDFTVYFFTLAFGVCVFYMFNSIYEQQVMFDMTKNQTQAIKAMCEVLSYISVVVAVILGFLIVYANGFFIKRRKKELGIYMTLGMGKRKISIILLLETSLIALIALIVGIVAGIFLSQFMSVFTAKIFEVNMTSFEFVFSFDAMVKSIIYFGIIFLVVIIFNVISVSGLKLIDLIYGSRKNQTLKIRNTAVNAVICIISMIILGAAYYIIVDNGMLNINEKFLTAIILGIVGTVLFFFSLSGLLTTLIRKNKRLYYSNLNMFTVRQLGSKINTNFISVSVVSIVLLLTIGIFATGYGIQDVYKDMVNNIAVYDYSINSPYLSPTGSASYGVYDIETGENITKNANDLSDIEKFIKDNKYVKNYAVCKEYVSDIVYGDFHIDWQGNNQLEIMNDVQIDVVKISDYNKMMKLIGRDKINLDNNHYAIMSNSDVFNHYVQQMINLKIEITVAGKKLQPYQLTKTPISNLQSVFMILPDNLVEKITKDSDYTEYLNLVLKNTDDLEKFEDELRDYSMKYYEKQENKDKYLFESASSKKSFYESVVSSKALISFIAIYLGLIFMITCAAILAIQQLTEASENKSRYELLIKLGADKKIINRALFTQILCYFVFPLGLAVVDSVFGLIAVQKTMENVFMINMSATLIPTAIFVGVLYAAYFLLTYISSKSIINKKIN